MGFGPPIGGRLSGLTLAINVIVMADGTISKFIWLFIGGIVGGAISLTYKTWVEPMVAPKPVLSFSAHSTARSTARFTLSNEGSAVATNVSLLVWATAPFAARTDIIDVFDAGGEVDASCTFGLYQAKLTGMVTSIPTALNTEAQAVSVQCDLIRPGESWVGSVTYQGPEAVFGLTALLKDTSSSEVLYGRFADTE